jgi:DeoR/GlpR family transcriptional regulator of sugar metabolism
MKTANHRREMILRHLNVETAAKVSEIAKRLSCSNMTIRRDLKRMEDEGLLIRTHGGALATPTVKLAFTQAEKVKRSRREKTAIGRAAAACVERGEHIMIGTGTTTMTMARELRLHEGVSVVTTSLAIVSALLGATGVECVLVGGTVSQDSPELFGPALEENLSKVHVDRVFIGTDSISAQGTLTAIDPRVARVTRLLLGSARRVVLLVDSSKANRHEFTPFGDLSQIECMITDFGMPADILNAARAAGVKTIVVRPK